MLIFDDEGERDSSFREDLESFSALKPAIIRENNPKNARRIIFLKKACAGFGKSDRLVVFFTTGQQKQIVDSRCRADRIRAAN